MNDGANGSGPLGGSDEFGRAIARISAAEICDAVGFTGSRPSVLDEFAEIIRGYILDLGKSASFYAGLSGRTSCNVLDVINGLEDLSLNGRFSGVYHVNHCVVGSPVVKEIIQFVGEKEELPFPHSIPNFPVIHHQKPIASFAERGETPREKHIPNWLPAFPDVHTYIHTPVWHEKKTDLQAEKVKQARQRRKQEKSLLRLQQRLALCNEASRPVKNVDDKGGRGKQVVDRNHLLVPPVPSGKRDSLQLQFPNGRVTCNRLSVLDAFAPAINAAKNGAFDHGVGDKNILPSKRPIVRFKFGIGNKYLTAPSPSNDRKADSLFLNDDEKDDKKRRAEMILKEAMENPHELVQL